MAVSYFGLIVNLNAEKALLFFVMLVIGLIVFERFLDYIEKRAHAAKFGNLIDKLFKEVMTMGLIGFIVLLLSNGFSMKNNDAYKSFQFSDITLFFMTIVSVFRACFVIYVSNNAIDGFWRAQNQNCGVLLERYKKTRSTLFTLESILFKYFPIFSNLFRDIEFKLMEDYFYEDFKISRHEFRFLDYLAMSNKHYAMEMLETSPTSWCAICLLAVLNFIRIELGFRCTSGHEDEDVVEVVVSNEEEGGQSRQLMADDDIDISVTEGCANYTTWYFFVCGVLLLVYGLLVAWMTWRSKVCLMQIAAGDSSNNYESILKLVMMRECKTELISTRRRNDDGGLKSPSVSRSIRGKTVNITDVFASTTNDDDDEDDEENSWHVISLRQVIGEHKKKEEERMKREKNQLIKRVLRSCGVYKWYERRFVKIKVHDLHLDKLEVLRMKRKHYHSQANSKLPGSDRLTKNPSMKGLRAVSNKARMVNGSSFRSDSLALCPKPPLRQASMKNVKVASSVGPNYLKYSASGEYDQDDAGGELEKEGEALIHPLMFELDQVFAFESRAGFKMMVELFQVFNALFIALWLTNYVFIALKSEHPYKFTAAIVASIAAMFYLLSFIQFHATCLLAVTSLQNEATVWMCEQDEMKNDILPRLRDEMLKLVDDKHFDKEVTMVFNLVKEESINRKKGGGIGLKQFHNLLQTLNLSFTAKEVRCLFRAMDTDGSASIDLAELKELLRANSSLMSRNAEKEDVSADRTVTRVQERKKRISGTLHMTTISSSLRSMMSTDSDNNLGAEYAIADSPSHHNLDAGKEYASFHELIADFD